MQGPQYTGHEGCDGTEMTLSVLGADESTCLGLNLLA